MPNSKFYQADYFAFGEEKENDFVLSDRLVEMLPQCFGTKGWEGLMVNPQLGKILE